MSLPVSWRRHFLMVLAGTSLVILLFTYHLTQIINPILIQDNEFFYYNLNKEEVSQPSQKCQIPRIHPFDPSILGYLTSSNRIVCKERIYDLTYVDENAFLKFNLTAVKLSGYVVEKLRCDYKEIIRKNDFEVEYGNAKTLPINGSRLEFDFVFVSCYNFAGIAFYTNVHCHIYPQKTNAGRAFEKSDSFYNVLILGIDSLSRLSFIRNLPKTYRFLIRNLNAFVFRGMTKVGDNTFPNLGAILTGKSVDGNELPHVEDPKGTYDVWPCLWKNFSEVGYTTLFAEDRPDIGLFTYLRGGLKKPPTDHYMRTFWLVVQTSKLHRMSSNLCFGNTPKHLLQLKYTSDFVKKYSNAKRPFFAFSFLVELSHDYVSQVQSADEDLHSWLEEMLHSGHLNKTFLLFLSDHGHRFDSVRATLIGRIEERMPFFALVTPEEVLSSKSEVANNLRINQGRLTTPYDIYFTTIDILNFSMNKLELGTTTFSRGSSLFGYISPNRTCLSAGIPDHYCICETEEELKTSDSRSQKAANTLVSTINKQLKLHTNSCSELTLAEIVRSDFIVPSREIMVNSRVYFGTLIEDGKATGMMNKLRVIIKTTPGFALFEGTLQFRDDPEQVSVLGDISRINKYGTQSSCIEDPVLRKFCFCSNLLH